MRVALCLLLLVCGLQRANAAKLDALPRAVVDFKDCGDGLSGDDAPSTGDDPDRDQRKLGGMRGVHRGHFGNLVGGDAGHAEMTDRDFH